MRNIMFCNNSRHKCNITRKCLLQGARERSKENQIEPKKAIERASLPLSVALSSVALYGFIWLSISLWLSSRMVKLLVRNRSKEMWRMNLTTTLYTHYKGYVWQVILTKMTLRLVTDAASGQTLKTRVDSLSNLPHCLSNVIIIIMMMTS